MKKLPLLLLCLALAVHSIAATTASTSTTSAPSPSLPSPNPRRLSPARSLPALPMQARRGGAAVKPKKTTASANKDKRISLAYPILAAYLYNLR